MNVVVACGGRSLERTISLGSGQRAASALRRLGCDVEVLDVDQSFTTRVRDADPDFVFMALHGAAGEDGTVQGVLDALSIAYTGSDATASGLCIDKHRLKTALRAAGLPTPPWWSFTAEAFSHYGAAAVLDVIDPETADGLVVKPAREGSSLGLTLVRDPTELRSALVGAFNYDRRVLLERFVPGRELAVTVVGPADSPRVLPVMELLFDGDVYGYDAHYEIGRADVRRAELAPELDERVQEIAARAYSLAGCRDFARVDVRLDGDEPYVLEINTLPGLGETGPTPLAADAEGWSFDELIRTVCARVMA